MTLYLARLEDELQNVATLVHPGISSCSPHSSVEMTRFSGC